MISQVDVLIFFITLVASAVFTAFVRRELLEADIRDNPIVSEHRQKSGTPTMGGLGILLGVCFIALLLSQATFTFSNSYLMVVTIFMVVAGIFGIFDDLLGFKVKEYQKVVRNDGSEAVQIGLLSLQPGEEARIASEKAKADYAKIVEEEHKLTLIDEIPIKSETTETEKIITQIILACFLILPGFIPSTIFGFDIGLLIIPVAIFAIIGSINSVNLIDGMDGLAAGIIAIASIASALYASVTTGSVASLPFVVIAGASVGFLVLNHYPAKVFMGDTGSYALGAGYMAAALIGNTFVFSVIALAVPIISVIISLLHRAHIITLPVEPLHHTLNYHGMSEQKIVILYWAVTLIVSVVALIAFGVI
ncbi:MAG: phospho-N-acetylmuramoyl-pentapeptide-transferase [Methanosphaera sp.]|uniref:glycosyltransferase family 4 protein n=1 Tax=Methanosphaera sp. TaxID=2666342 RepID=UPI0025E7B46C|nr:phospho-N-acetylmuramoyl-pentapeptide-transferase [Methanosphaera sp.]MCI5867326.1 phospho-N-acetylmuramoyl-pentapeptide-transferase [Methanosphaera sp.]MDD6534606.1 phospho-N-acetylmuramoyl-pentapeptide-transferase [Methanosphaera sp.]MDY3955726.1 phospho-N-acetylmuramoyl-pentapeptide-transferase [Methanosphaera sp.]